MAPNHLAGSPKRGFLSFLLIWDALRSGSLKIKSELLSSGIIKESQLGTRADENPIMLKGQKAAGTLRLTPKRADHIVYSYPVSYSNL